MAATLDEILALLGDDVLSVVGPRVAGAFEPVPLEGDARAGGLSFCSEGDEAAVARIRRSGAGLVLCQDGIAARLAEEDIDKTLVVVPNPRLAYIEVLDRLFPCDGETGIDPRAAIHASVELGDGVYVGPHTVIDEHCRIGERSVLDANVRIYRETLIGRNVRVFAGAVLGADGFGFERDASGRLRRFPQRGHVEIGDEVEIGANVCIDRAALDVTRIGAGTKIDDLAYVAHNVQIGRDCLVMASAILAGSSIIGERVEISPGAVIRDKVRIGDGARIGMGAVVVADVAEGVTVAGVPARPLAGRGT